MMKDGDFEFAFREIFCSFMYCPLRNYKGAAISIVRFTRREPRCVQGCDAHFLFERYHEGLEKRRSVNSMCLPELSGVFRKCLHARKVKIRYVIRPLAIKKLVAG